MPKPARVVIPGLPHHLTHRGNRRLEVFHHVEDYEIYLRLLRKHADRNKVSLEGYSLMPNHVHLVAVPQNKESLSDMVQEVHGTFAALLNAKYGMTGHCWEGRFFSCPLDQAHFWNTLRYVELNAVRAGLVKKAEDYSWSSAAAHCGLRDDRLLAKRLLPAPVMEDWSAWLSSGNSRGIDDYIRAQTFAGHPCGCTDYFREIEKSLGRSLLPRPRGRPAKIGK
jgi:putative transposase